METIIQQTTIKTFNEAKELIKTDVWEKKILKAGPGKWLRHKKTRLIVKSSISLVAFETADDYDEIDAGQID